MAGARTWARSIALVALLCVLCSVASSWWSVRNRVGVGKAFIDWLPPSSSSSSSSSSSHVPAHPTAPTSQAVDALLSVRTSLSRPLCTVVVMGTNVTLEEAPTWLHEQFPNCYFHVTSNEIASWPPPPPFVFMHHRVFLVDDTYDAVSVAADAYNATVDVVPRNTLSWDVLFPRQALSARSFFNTLERHRIAAVVVRPQTEVDVAALQDVIKAYGDEEGFMDVLIVEEPAWETSQLRLSLDRAGYRPLSELSLLLPQCDHKRVSVFWRPTSPARFPVAPTMFVSSTNYGRWTNQVIQDARIMSYLSELCGRKNTPDVSCVRTFLPSERHVHHGAMTTIYNFTKVAEVFGRRNAILSITELATIDTVGWCGGQPSDCHGIDNLVSCTSNSSSSSSSSIKDECVPDKTCWRRLPMADHVKATASTAVAITGHDQCNPHVGVVTSRDPGVFYGGSDAFWQDLWVTAGMALDTYWLSYSDLIVELANRQYAIHERRLRKYWKLGADQPVRVLALHMRMTDYGWGTDGTTLWEDSVQNAVDYIRNTSSTGNEVAFHGMLVCTDDIDNKMYRSLLKVLPNAPKLDCVSDLVFDKGSIGHASPVIQYMLAKSTCFIGFVLSSYSQRVEIRRRDLGRFMHPCDTLIVPPETQSRADWMWSIGANPIFYRDPDSVKFTRAPGDNRPLPRW